MERGEKSVSMASFHHQSDLYYAVHQDDPQKVGI